MNPAANKSITNMIFLLVKKYFELNNSYIYQARSDQPQDQDNDYVSHRPFHVS